MAKRKNKKSWFIFGPGRKKKRTPSRKKQRFRAVRTTLWIFVFIIFAAGLTVGLMFLDRYVKGSPDSVRAGVKLELVDVPVWAGAGLEAKIIAAAKSGNEPLMLDTTTAESIGNNLEHLAWLYDVKVRLGSNSVIITAGYRRPVGLLRSGGRRYYVDKDMFVLDYVPVNGLAIPEITGVRSERLLNRSYVGRVFSRDDLAAALEILGLLRDMDSRVCADKPLTAQIKSIDVSNYDGRRSRSKPHIVLFALDGTEIRWGVRKGAWHKYLEARDEEKLVVLYNTYKQFGTLELKSHNKANYIDLRPPLATDSY